MKLALFVSPIHTHVSTETNMIIAREQFRVKDERMLTVVSSYTRDSSQMCIIFLVNALEYARENTLKSKSIHYISVGETFMKACSKSATFP